ncbi:acyltransferase family protein [Nocardioides sp. B-3]|uniref:acyltransferase family protein n=1 Tax=Nocardioides sp. B-3 TaxID=2895565 RepID=UPI00215236F2|nr:acyltransferase family protein [Nocardioides sp. B-3]UUZ57633.1 acyltransferase family protein [Nocardioides sp. B-3]
MVFIVLWHTLLTVIPQDPTPPWSRFFPALGGLSQAAVLSFIVLSGYLPGRHWRPGDPGTETRRYLLRRSWRLLPPYWFVVTLTILAMLLPGLRHPGGSHWDVGLPMTWTNTALNYLLLTDFAGISPYSHPMWSVPVEFHLYLLAPLVVLVRRRAVTLALGTVLTLGIAFAAPGFIAPFFALAFVSAFWDRSAAPGAHGHRHPPAPGGGAARRTRRVRDGGPDRRRGRPAPERHPVPGPRSRRDPAADLVDAAARPVRPAGPDAAAALQRPAPLGRHRVLQHLPRARPGHRDPLAFRRRTARPDRGRRAPGRARAVVARPQPGGRQPGLPLGRAPVVSQVGGRRQKGPAGMRILIEAMSAKFGGIRTYVDNLLPARSSVAPGDEVHVLVQSDSTIDVPAPLLRHDIAVRGPEVLARPPAQTRALRRLVRELEPDVVLATLPATTLLRLDVPLAIVVYDLRHELRPEQFGRARRALRWASYNRGYAPGRRLRQHLATHPDRPALAASEHRGPTRRRGSPRRRPRRRLAGRRTDRAGGDVRPSHQQEPRHGPRRLAAARPLGAGAARPRCLGRSPYDRRGGRGATRPGREREPGAVPRARRTSGARWRVPRWCCSPRTSRASACPWSRGCDSASRW